MVVHDMRNPTSSTKHGMQNAMFLLHLMIDELNDHVAIENKMDELSMNIS